MRTCVERVEWLMFSVISIILSIVVSIIIVQFKFHVLCFVWSFCSILCTCTSCDPSVIGISGWIVLVNQLDWVRVLWSSNFRIVLKQKNASPRTLVHRLLKRQQLLHLHHTLDNLPGLTGRMDTPDNWRKRRDALQEPSGRRRRR